VGEISLGDAPPKQPRRPTLSYSRIVEVMVSKIMPIFVQYIIIMMKIILILYFLLLSCLNLLLGTFSQNKKIKHLISDKYE
jgi:hypothetical protein